MRAYGVVGSSVTVLISIFSMNSVHSLSVRDSVEMAYFEESHRVSPGVSPDGEYFVFVVNKGDAETGELISTIYGAKVSDLRAYANGKHREDGVFEGWSKFSEFRSRYPGALQAKAGGARLRGSGGGEAVRI